MCAHSAVFQSWSVDWSHCPACHGGSPVVQTATGHRGGWGGWEQRAPKLCIPCTFQSQIVCNYGSPNLLHPLPPTLFCMAGPLCLSKLFSTTQAPLEEWAW